MKLNHFANLTKNTVQKKTTKAQEEKKPKRPLVPKEMRKKSTANEQINNKTTIQTTTATTTAKRQPLRQKGRTSLPRNLSSLKCNSSNLFITKEEVKLKVKIRRAVIAGHRSVEILRDLSMICMIQRMQYYDRSRSRSNIDLCICRSI